MKYPLDIIRLLSVCIFFFPLVLHSQNILLKSDHYFDSEKGVFGSDIEVLIRNKQILAVGKNLEYETGKTTIIDLGNVTLLPGLIDSHTHILIEEDLHPGYTGFGETVVKNVIAKSDTQRALEGAFRAKSYLHEGFTAIRDLGNSGLYADVDLRNAIDNNLIEGPRLFVSGPGIAATGGQVNGTSFHSNKIITNKDYQVITGEQEAINAVRDHILMRVDVIKVYADNIPNRTTLSINELKTIVNEAKRHDKKVTAHAITNQAVWNAVKAGVNSIEHAYVISDTTLALVKKNKITLIPTYSNKELSHELFKKSGIIDSIRRNRIVNRSADRQQKQLLRLYKSGVKLAYGSDFYSKTSFSRGENAKKSIYAWLEAGVPIEKVLQYATINAAEQLTRRKILGVLKKGFLADIIAVEGDLSKDENALEKVVFVMKDGKIFKNKQ
ncbi:amidohydrolase family protein [Flavobacteriaceae bacterium R38]|nr:amidohydrolase family protein [Flavobacteriaceae bacterium R38]